MKNPRALKMPLLDADKGGGGGADPDKKGDELPSWAKTLQDELADLKTKMTQTPPADKNVQVIPKAEPPKDKEESKAPAESKSSEPKKQGFLDWLLG